MSPPAGPTPRTRRPEPDEAALVRNLWCERYDECLVAVMRAGWASWSCEGCVESGHAARLRRQEATRWFQARNAPMPTRIVLPTRGG